MKRAALTLLFIIACFIPAFSQSQSSAVPSVEILKAKIKTFKNDKRYGVRYDKFTDVTTVWFRFDWNEGGRKLGAIIQFTSKSYQDQPNRFLVYEDRNYDWQHLEPQARELYALIDGERLALGVGERDSKVSGGSYRGAVSVGNTYPFA